MKSLKLAFNPYTYTRVAVMRTLLLKKEDYDRIMKLNFSEIAGYLQKTPYGKQIDELGLKFSGPDLLEQAMNKNLLDTFDKLKRISDDKLRLAIKTYMMREDFHNIKVIIRGKFIKESDIESMILPIGFLSKEKLNEMQNSEKIYDVLELSGLLDMDNFKEEKNNEGKIDLFELENKLDREYFNMILDFAERIKKSGKIFAEFLKNEIDIVNILNLFKLKIAGKDTNEIKKYIINSGNVLNARKLALLAESKTKEEMIAELKGTIYYNTVKNVFEQDKTLLFFKAKLYKQLLDRSLMLLHKNPLSVDVILAFALTKEIEVKNLKMIVKGKQLGIPNNIIEQEIIIESKIQF